MNLKSILFAALMSATSGRAIANETLISHEPKTPQEQAEISQQKAEEEEQKIEQFVRKETGGIAISAGYALDDKMRYVAYSASFIQNGYMVDVRFRRQDNNIMEEEDEMNIAGLTLAGTRKNKAYQADIAFGIELADFERKWYDLRVMGQFAGGFQVVESVLYLDGQDIPDDPDISFFTGLGAKGEAAFRIPRMWGYYFSLGVGGTAEYFFSEEDEFIQNPVKGFQGSLYALLRFSKEKRKKELRFKKD